MNLTTCPYCNSRITVSAADDKARCPRCAQPLPAHFLAGLPATPPFPAAGPAPSANGARLPLPQSRHWSNRWLAGGFVLLMAGMAVAALALALGTLKSRKTRDPRMPAATTSVRALPPAELPALSYLPEDCNVVAGIHVADIRHSAATKRLLEPPRPDWLDKGLAWIEGWTGLQVSDLDHVALGSKLDGAVPQLVVALRTHQAYRLEEIARRFPGKAFPHHKRPLFRIKLQPLGGGYLWCADERTLVLLLRPDAVKIEDMVRVPAHPRLANTALADPLRKNVEEHLRQADVWLAGDLEKSTVLSDLLNFFPFLSKHAPPLAQARSFAVGVRDEGDLTILGFLRVRDPADLRAWREFLETVPLPDVASRRVIPAAEQLQIDFQLRIPAAKRDTGSPTPP
jgi:hypothetical protein